MKKKLIISLLAIFAIVSSANAQDTIDTNYYRYNFHFSTNNVSSVLDSSTFEPVIDSETGDIMPLCPNGEGFYGKVSYAVTSQSIGWLLGYPYFSYNQYVGLDTVTRFVYGIAVALDSVEKMVEGDSVTLILCKASEDQSHFIHLDSIVLRGGDIGKERWLEMPILNENLIESFADLSYSFTPHQNCNDSMIYSRILEFYFDNPVILNSKNVFWKVRVSIDNGSRFFLGWGHHHCCVFATFNDDCTPITGGVKMVPLFPILTPLPGREAPTMDIVIPLPQKPDDPGNPQDPEDPDNPGDPVAPIDPEAINGVYGNLPISIYPNPTDGMTTISSPEAIKELTVTDLAGRVLLHQSSLGTTTTLDTAPLEPGLYLLKVTTASGTATTKLAVR